MDTVKDRLIYYLNYIGISKSEFGRRIGVSNAFVTSIRKSIQPDKISAIQQSFPDLNASWLLTGEGEMLKGEGNASFMGVAQNAQGEGVVPVKFFEATPTATFQEFCVGASEAPSSIEIIPLRGESLDETFCVFEVSGESMAPQINDHARVLCQEVPPSRWHTLRNCVVVIAYADKFVIKRIASNKLQDKNWLELSSDNPEYPDREKVCLSNIRCIFQAKRIISSDIV